MKKIYKNKILNVPDTNIFDTTFLFEYFGNISAWKEREIIYLKDMLETRKNEEMFQKVAEKPAMYSEVYSPKDELEIFRALFDNALKYKKKIHIIGITLVEEVKILEEYYEELGFMREDINAFDIDFSIPLVTASCNIENLIWKGSDYKAQREKIFFCPPIRETGNNKALFKWITRGVIAGIEISPDSWESGLAEQFLWDCIREEKILPLFMGKILKYNIEDAGLVGDIAEIKINY